jgi:hypothetical protein
LETRDDQQDYLPREVCRDAVNIAVNSFASHCSCSGRAALTMPPSISNSIQYHRFIRFSATIPAFAANSALDLDLQAAR